MEEKRKDKKSSVIDVRLFNDTFVKLRKVKKQVLLEQTFDRVDTKSTNSGNYSNSTKHHFLHNVCKISLNELNGINSRSTVIAFEKAKEQTFKSHHNKQQHLKDDPLKENMTNEFHNPKDLASITENGHVYDEKSGNALVVNSEPLNQGRENKSSLNVHGNNSPVNDKEDNQIARKTSTIISKNAGKVCRRDSVVAMSTRKMSLANTAQKSKIRKTSFVAPRSNIRRKSSIEPRIKPPERGIHLKDKQEILHKETRRIDVGITISDDKTRLAVDVVSVVSSLHDLYPLCNIELVSHSGQCLYASNSIVDDKEQKKSADMAPRNESPMPVYNEKSTITDIITDLKRKPNNVSSLIEFCRKMSLFAFDDSLNVLLAKQEGISHIIRAMHNHKNNLDLVTAACHTLLRMTSFSDANCVLIHKENGIVILTDLLKLYIDDAEPLLIILDICGHLAMSEDTNVTDSLLEHSCHHTILTGMSRHGDNVDVVKQCCFILSHLVNTAATARSLMFIGGVHVIIGVMEKYKENNDVLENGCRALGSFAVHDELCMDVANAGAVSVVLSALERSTDDEYFLECVTWGLACLSKYEETCKGLHHTNAMQQLVNGMKKFHDKETIQEYGCWSICNIVAHDSKLDVSLSYDIVKVLLDAVSLFLENIDLQEQIMFTLSNLITSSESFLYQFIEYNGIALIIKTMQLYPDHCQIQENGCRIIGNVAVQDKHRMKIEAAGGSKVVVNAMLMFTNCTDIQEVGCLTLTNITANVYRNKVSAVKNGCITAVLKCIAENTDSDDIVLSGLKTICNVIEIDESCYNFLEEDGLNTLSHVLNNWTTNATDRDIYLFAANALSRLSMILGIEEVYVNETEKLLFLIKNITEEDQEAVLCLCRFYENLLRSKKGYQMFSKGKGLHYIHECIDGHIGDIHIQTSCCKIIAAVCLYEKDSGTEQYHVLQKVMQNFPNNGDIQMICCGAIVYIADNSEKEREYLVRRDAVTLVMTAIKTHNSNEKLLDVGLMALDVLITKNNITENVRCIRKLVLRLLHTYPDNPDIQIHGCKLITKLPIIDDVNEDEKVKSENTCDHIVNILKKRRSNGELQSVAIEALRTLLTDQPEYVVQKIKEQLSYLKNEIV